MRVHFLVSSSLRWNDGERGFSLVELSVVLVILGLLVGGILAGRSLVRAAELRAVPTEYARYQTAILAFRDKYFALPGDFNRAEDIWGTAPHCPGAHDQGSTDGRTCNGNADGEVWITGSVNAPTANELYRFWQHLANAGLIEGQYNGVTTSTTGSYGGIGKDNTPASRLAGGHWSVDASNNVGGTWNSQIFRYHYVPYRLQLGGIISQALNRDPILTPTETWNIDVKMDDGKPGRGILMSRAGNNLCIDAADNSNPDAAYRLAHTAKSCFLYFWPR